MEILVHLSPWSTLLSRQCCRHNTEAVLRALKASEMGSTLLQTGPRNGGGEHGGKERPFKWTLLLCNSNLREVHYRGQFVSFTIHSSSSRTCRMALWPLVVQERQTRMILWVSCSSGVCFPPSGSKSDGLLLKIGSPKAHCYRRVLVFNMSHVCHLAPSVASLTMIELFKARAVKQNEMALLKKSCLCLCFPRVVSQFL